MNGRRLIISPILSAALLLLSYPPLHLLLPQFVALVPLLHFIDNEEREWRSHLGALLCGLLFWGGLLYWLTLFTRAGYVVVALIMSMNLVLLSWAGRRLKRKMGLPLALSAPLVWTAAEYVHAHTDIAFTWGQLAYTLTGYPLWLQFASLTGPYGVSLWIVLVNAAVYGLWKRYLSGARLRAPVIALAVLLTVPLMFGIWRYGTYDSGNGGSGTLRVSYVQPSIPQFMKWTPEMRDSTFSLLGKLSMAQADSEPGLVVWPEAAAPATLRLDGKYRPLVGRVAERLDCWLLTGAPEYRYNEAREKYDSFNSAFLFNPEGEITASYDKMHLVPVSERMPWEDLFPFLQEVDVGGSHFVPGERYEVFEMKTPHGRLEKFGALICFESIFPEISREFVRRGARFLVNITNDAWFERTSAAYQHSSFLVLRAIEQNRPVVRSANTGVSAFYDRLGRRRAATSLYEITSRTGEIMTRGDLTIYNRAGDWPAHACWIGTVLLLLLSFTVYRRGRR